MIERLYRHNAWANAKVFGVCRQLEPGLLDEEMPGTVQTIAHTLKHLVGVEEIYLAMLRGERPDAAGSMEEYFGRDLSWFDRRVDEIGDAYLDWIRSPAAADRQRDLQIPWFDFPVSVEEGLVQVLSHSVQHRSQVLTVLSARGMSVPDLDYVVMLGEERRPKP